MYLTWAIHFFLCVVECFSLGRGVKDVSIAEPRAVVGTPDGSLKPLCTRQSFIEVRAPG